VGSIHSRLTKAAIVLSALKILILLTLPQTKHTTKVILAKATSESSCLSLKGQGNTAMNDTAGDEVIYLHNKGDLVLAIRDASGYNYRRFLVSSTILSHASRVFAAMFGPHFKEGHQLRESGEPPVIDLQGR
jgi:hypothetical protein